MDIMNKIEIFKALSNETRLNIIEWLKEPEKNFPPQGGHLDHSVDLKGGVCVGSIRDKAGISQSTISHYLDILQKADLLLAERHGKWTYYRRNEATLAAMADFFHHEI